MFAFWALGMRFVYDDAFSVFVSCRRDQRAVTVVYTVTCTQRIRHSEFMNVDHWFDIASYVLPLDRKHNEIKLTIITFTSSYITLKYITRHVFLFFNIFKTQLFELEFDY